MSRKAKDLHLRRPPGSKRNQPPPPPRNGVDAFFSITARGSTLTREIRGGFVTFFTMAYIVVLNPIIIGFAKDKHGHTLGDTKVAAVTALVAGVMTILMGVIGRYPFAIAAGLGLNALLAFSIAPHMSWADAMGLVVLEGLIITVLVLTGFRTAIFRAVPQQLKYAISVGIGLFIAIIGFVDAGFVRATGAGSPPLQLGISGRYGSTLQGWPTVVFCFGVLLIVVLMVRNIRGAILIGMIAATLLGIIIEAIGHIGGVKNHGGKISNPGGWQLNVPKWPHKWFSSPDLSLVGHFSPFGAFKAVGTATALVLILTLVLSDFFDAMGTTVGLAAEGNLLDERGDLPNVGRVLLVDGVAAAAGGAASASSQTTYVESAAGIGDGARTGLASVVTGLLFLVALLVTPLVRIVPAEAAAPALVVVGFLLISQVRGIDWSDMTIAIPAFLMIVVMPFTYSITNGLGAGFISYVVLQAATGRTRRVHPLMWGVAALFLVYFALHPIEELFNVK
ncbi:MAG: NCS2 family permease [Mycobacteriales bacterium]